MSYKVSARDNVRLRLNEADTVSSVLQNLSIILRTRWQSVPYYRAFGLPMRFVDKPLPVAKALLVSEVEQAIRDYEPRASVIRVYFDEGDLVSGSLYPVVEVDIADV